MQTRAAPGSSRSPPFEKRTGKLPVKLPTVVDVRFYYMCVELPDNKLKTKSIKLDKGFNYT